jgi:integrase-like protein
LLIKLCGTDPEEERRYSPATCIGAETRVVTGTPEPAAISTSYAERQNRTMRMSMRRFTHLTNAFSKKVQNLEHAVALHFMHYNFARRHMSLDGATPAMAAGLTDRPWTIAETVELVEARERQSN